MAIIRTGPIVAGISGSIGGQTFVNARGGLIARTRSYRKPNHSATLLEQQSTFANTTRRWRTLTAQQRAAWRALASDHPKTNRLGLTSNQTGFNVYVAVTMNRFRASGAFFDDPPTIQEVSIPMTFVPSLQLLGDYAVQFTLNATPPGIRVQIWGSRHLSEIDPRWPPDFRIVGEANTPGVPFFFMEFFEAWEAAFGAMKTGERYSLRIIYYSPNSDLFPRAPIPFLGAVLPA